MLTRLNDQAIATRVGIATQVDITLLLDVKNIEALQRIDDVMANRISVPRLWKPSSVAVDKHTDVREIVIVLDDEREVCICFSALVSCCM